MTGFDRVPALRLAAALVCCTMCGQSHAQSTIDTTTLAGVPLIKTLHSMKDIRYSHIVSQQYDYSCGAAALATLLKFGYGIDIPETELIRRMMAFSTPEVVVKNGFSMLDMKKFVETIGLRGRGFRVNTDALYHLQIPVMVLMNINGYEHFVIVKHAEEGRKSWNGLVFAVLGKPFREDSPLLQDNESLALKLRANALATGTAATPFVEYGLIKAELF
jgi:uncharacterized protein